MPDATSCGRAAPARVVLPEDATARVARVIVTIELNPTQRKQIAEYARKDGVLDQLGPLGDALVPSA